MPFLRSYDFRTQSKLITQLRHHTLASSFQLQQKIRFDRSIERNYSDFGLGSEAIMYEAYGITFEVKRITHIFTVNQKKAKYQNEQPNIECARASHQSRM